MTDLEHAKRAGIAQFLRRRKYAIKVGKIDNQSLPVGSSMFFYCRHCDILVESLPEDYLFPPRKICSQCKGLEKEGWLKDAINEAGSL